MRGLAFILESFLRTVQQHRKQQHLFAAKMLSCRAAMQPELSIIYGLAVDMENRSYALQSILIKLATLLPYLLLVHWVFKSF